MASPKTADTRPAVVDLDPGTYEWCACGHSKDQPFCDGSHKTTEFRPVTFEITEIKKVALCMCKQTANKPFCDGTHKTVTRG